MLVFVRDRFIQVLEGEQKAVEELYDRIKKDNRHKKIQILLEGHLPSRLFGNWSMGFKSLGLPEFEQLSGYQEPEKFFRAQAVDDQTHPALVFLHLFYQAQLDRLWRKRLLIFKRSQKKGTPDGQ